MGESSNTSQVIVQNVQDAPFPTGVILDDKNYPLWSQLMEMRIGARNKSGFITGKTPKPKTDEKKIKAWLIDNHRVKSWLIDSMSPPLMRRFIRLQTAAEIWDAVGKTFYDGTDETQLFELNWRSFTTRQNGRSLSTCFNELKPWKKISHATVATSSQSEEGTTPIAAHTSAKSGMLHHNHASNNGWIIDTGATDHMTNDSKIMTTFSPKRINICTANGSTTPITGEGSVKISNSLDLNSVLVVPSLSANLLSVSQITKALNCYVIFWPNNCVFQDMTTHQILGYGTRWGRLYYLEENHQIQAHHTRISQANKSMAWLWHLRLGHLSFNYLRKLKPNLFLNIMDSDFKCDTCELAKNKRISYVPSFNKTSVPFMTIHSNVRGSARIPTPSGARYFVTFVDECTRMIWISLLKNKWEVHYALKELHHIIKSEYQREIQILQSDNGGEYINHEMQLFCKENSICQQTSCAGTP
ncbi:putative RNA-directed DNA polymerase [Tanacetum coccineum]